MNKQNNKNMFLNNFDRKFLVHQSEYHVQVIPEQVVSNVMKMK